MPKSRPALVVLVCAASVAAGAVFAATDASAAGAAPQRQFVGGQPPRTGRVVQTVGLPGGHSIRVDAGGRATEVDSAEHVVASRMLPPAARTALGRATLPADTVRRLFRPTTVAPAVVVTLDGSAGPRTRAAFRAVGARRVTALAVPGTVRLTLADRADVARALRTLRRDPAVRSVEAVTPVSSQATGGVPLPASAARDRAAHPRTAGDLPSNYAVSHSLGAFLNGNGVDAMGAYSTLEGQYHQLPGAGEIITNVSVGDLTDRSMAATDPYVRFYGPTTVVRHGQRYLDLPAMPLIPTYVSDSDGSLDPTGSTEGVDPTLGEVMLDFGVMAPLPHNLQRSAALGTGATDLLGIAPGAKYRLVVPAEPTTDQIAVAMLAAARQTPRPNVITASLGVGTDQIGFPGRYLEDDPLLQSVIATIVHRYGIVVTISSNDGTRLYTPTAVNPDGGSTPTDLTRSPGDTTQVGDDAYSTTPSRVLDSGAIAVGATTLDDVLTQPGQPTGSTVRTGTFATTRINGSTAYSSGFGTRLDVSAPGDGIAVFEHTVGGSARDVTPVLNGGTSASAPEVAAAAAVVQQASRLAGHRLGPLQIRALLERTGRTVASPRQSDRPTVIGPQIDLSAAVDAVLPARRLPAPAIVRISVAHRVDLGNLDGSFSEDTDPQRLDLTGNPPGTPPSSHAGSGEGLLGPVTFGVDTVGITGSGLRYRLLVGHTAFASAAPAIRITPSQLLLAAGRAVVADHDRHIGYRVQVLRGTRVLAARRSEITVGGTDGTYTVARAPVVPPRVRLGSRVRVSYDLTGVRETTDPRLVVSTVGHWSVTGGLFWPGYSVALTKPKGTITLPASAFTGGGGLYGVGIAQQTLQTSSTPNPAYNLYADMASVLVLGTHGTSRPPAPQLTLRGRTAGPANGHVVDVTRADPGWDLHYDVRTVPGARAAIYEISASGPTVFGALNTVTNAFGTQRDVDGISTPSTRFVTVDGTHGTLHLDARSLPTDAVFYNVRVFAADSAGRVLGEASPTSGLFYDDGLAPDGGTVESFDAVSGPDSVAAVTNPEGGQTLFRFGPATGRYGRALVVDQKPGDGFQVVGVDPAEHAVLLLHFDSQTRVVRVETRNTHTGRLVGHAVAYPPTAYLLLGGRVDPARHRAVLLGRAASDGADVVIPVDLTTGIVGAPVDADTGDTPAASFNDVRIDPGDGAALLAGVTGGQFCAQFGSAPLARVGTDGTVTTASAARCLATYETAPGSDRLWTLTYRTFSLNFAGPSVLGSVPLNSLDSDPSGGLVRTEPPSLLAVDGVNNVVAAGFALPVSPPRVGSQFGYPIDSNATGQLAVLDPSDGSTTSLVTGVEFGGAASRGAYNSVTERRVQLDPTTRTGWTFSADGSQLQAFHY